MKKLIITLVLLCSFISVSEAQVVYQGVTRFISTTGQVCGPTQTSCNITATGGAFHQLTWNVLGTLSACSVRVDSSADNVTWNSGDIIAAQTCTSNGQVISTSHIVNYVRVNVTSITPVSTATLQVNLTGYQTSPSGGGTVTSVGGTAPISSSGGNTPVISCLTCAIGPGASTAGHIATFSGTDGLTLADGGAGGTGTVTNTGASLPNNTVVLGNTAPDIKADTKLTTDGAGALTTTTGGIALTHTQGTITTSNPTLSHTVTWNAGGVAFTNWISNITCTAAATASFALKLGVGGTDWQFKYNGANCTVPQLFAPNGSPSNPAYSFANSLSSGMYWTSNNSGTVVLAAGFDSFSVKACCGPVIRSDIPLAWASTNNVANTVTVDTTVNRCSAGLVCAGTSVNANDSTAGFKAIGFDTNTNCSNAASPAVCGSATGGVIAVPTGTNPTLTINTTKITSTSEIFLQIDESATIAATTCNTTLSTLVQPVVTARVVGTSFTIQIGAVIATNPVCVSYFIVNPV